MVSVTAAVKIRELIHTILDTLFPDYCVGCAVRGEILCERCLLGIPLLFVGFGGTISIYPYDNRTVRAAIRALKYKNNYRLAAILGARLHEELLPMLAERFPIETETAEKLLVVPVPASPSRMRERGYNQAELLARAFAACDPALYELGADRLRKIKDTQSQVRTESKTARLRNLVGSFGVSPEAKLAGRVVLLIDDVTTTGATLAEGIKVLKKAGAREVLGVTVAH